MRPYEFAEVALSYQGQLWNAALRLARERSEAEDFLQETYRRAFEHAHELRSLAHCRPWMFRILTSLVIDARRRERSGPAIVLLKGGESTEPEGGFEQHADFEAEILDRLAGQEIEGAIRSLPEPMRMALRLCDVEGFTYQEISEILNCPIGTVRSRIARARADLMARLLHHAQARGFGKPR